MDKPKGYDELKAYNREGSTGKLPINAYVCKIMSASDVETQSGYKAFDIFFDIAEGVYTNYFAKKFQGLKEAKAEGKIDRDPNWGGRLRILQPNLSDYESGNAERRKKYEKSRGLIFGFFTSVQESNAGYIYNFDDKTYKTLQGKYVGIVFNEDTYMGHTFPKATLAVSSDVARKMQSGELNLPIFGKKKSMEAQKDEGQKLAEDYANYSVFEYIEY
jgi:hypothetical protein